jgi:DNA replication protein DnaC
MALEAAIAAWDEQTPAEFREPLQIDRLPTNPQIIQAALSWRPSQTPTHSLLLAGPSRSGKTRILYALARSLVANNISVTLIPMDRFALWARLHSSEGSKSEADWITHLATVNVLILDDLGKGRLTPTAEDALFASIRERHAHRRPTLISTQENRSTLASKFHDQASAVAIIERILETSTQLRFGNKPTQANQQSLETTNQQPKKN